MRGVVIKNAYFDSPVYVHQCRRICEELNALGVDCTVKRNDFFPARVDNGVLADFDYDFCVYLDKDKYLSELLEKRGVRLFNRHSAVLTCDDKMATGIALAGVVPMPVTLPGLLCYTENAQVSRDTAVTVGKTLGYPLVIKTCHGSMGKGVFLANNEEELLSLMQNLKSTPHLFQQFISASTGRDLRVIVVGGKALGCMERRSNGDFRSNIGSGGVGIRRPLDEDARKIAEDASKALRLDFCGVDLLFGADGYKLCEVNSNAFFEEFERVTGINVASAYAKLIVETMTE